MIQPTTCFYKIAELKKPIRIVCGGSHAGKTYSNLLYLIYYALNRDVLISVVMESNPALSRSAYKDFIDILKLMNLYDKKRHNITKQKYKLNDSVFEFFGADNADSLRGGRRDVLYICECNRVSFEAFNQLSSRTRRFTLLDYNPTATFWVDTELLINDIEKVDFIRVTYEDNEFLNEKTLEEIAGWERKSTLSEYWLNYWKVYGLGLSGSMEGAVYKDWSIVEILPEEAELLGSGIDFGFTNDPTALISVYRFDNDIIVDEVIYQKGLLNNQLASLIQANDAKSSIIYADSAEPKTIAELKSYGLNVLPVVKGKDSISYGIQLIQSQPIKITSRSTNLLNELQNYTWAKDKSDKKLSIPIDAFNHGLDALRYFFLMKFGKKGGGFATFKWRR